MGFCQEKEKNPERQKGGPLEGIISRADMGKNGKNNGKGGSKDGPSKSINLSLGRAEQLAKKKTSGRGTKRKGW